MEKFESYLFETLHIYVLRATPRRGIGIAPCEIRLSLPKERNNAWQNGPTLFPYDLHAGCTLRTSAPFCGTRYIRVNNEKLSYVRRGKKQVARRFAFPTKKINVHAAGETPSLAFYALCILKRENRLRSALR